MASGSFETPLYQGSTYSRNVYVSWSSTNETPTSTYPGGRSKIHWVATAHGTEKGYIVSGPITVKINGTTVVNVTSRINLTYGYNLGSGDIWVEHGTDGTKSVAVSIDAAIYSGSVNRTYSGNITMTRNTAYSLSTTLTNARVSVSRTTSAGAGATGTVGTGNYKLAKGDVIKITATPGSTAADEGNYSISSLKVNGSTFSSGSTYTVSGNVSITATATALASTITLGATTAKIGGTITITIAKKNTAYYHSLYYSFAGQNGNSTGYIKADGTTSSSEVRFQSSSASQAITFTVPTAFAAKQSTNTSGTCTITCRTYAAASGGSYLGSLSTKTFTAYGKRATVSPGATSVNTGDTITLTLSKYTDSTYTHSLKYVLAGESGNTANRWINFDGTSSTSEVKLANSVDSVTLNVPTTFFYSALPTTTSGVVTVTCTTYYNTSTSVGTTTATFTVNIPTSVKPAVSGTVTDTNSVTTALTGNSSKLVLNQSTAQATINYANGVTVNGATITTRKINGSTLSTSATSKTYSKVTTTSFTFTATDSRGRSATATVSPTVVNYVNVTCVPNITRETPTGSTLKISASGNYFDGSFGSVANTLKIQYRYKLATASSYGSWTTISGTVTKSNNKYTLAATSISGTFAYNVEYDFQVWALDKIWDASTTARTPTAFTVEDVGGTPVFDFGKEDFAVNVALKAKEILNHESLDAGSFSRICPVGCYSFNDLGIASDVGLSTFFETWTKKICAMYPNRTNDIFIGSATPNSRGVVMCEIYNTSALTNGLPEYATGCYFPLGSTGRFYTFGTYSYSYKFSVYRPTSEQFSGTVTYASNEVVSSINCTLRKQGETCVLDFSLTPTGTSGNSQWVTIGTITSGYYPQNAPVIITPVWSATYSYAALRVTTGGNFQIYKNSTSTASINGQLVWISNTVSS